MSSNNASNVINQRRTRTLCILRIFPDPACIINSALGPLHPTWGAGTHPVRQCTRVHGKGGERVDRGYRRLDRFQRALGLVRERFFTPRLRFKSYDEMNAWLTDHVCERLASPAGLE